MTHELFETACNGAMLIKRKIISFESFEAAERFAREVYDIAYFEADADHPGCADFITKVGTIFAIQPIGFKLSGIAA